MSTSNQIVFLPAVKFIVTIAIILSGLIGGMFFLNKQRNNSIVAEYTQESLKYASDNSQGLNQLFTEIFDNAVECGNTFDTTRSDCNTNVRLSIYKNISSDLRDFSSTFFIRLKNNKVEVLTLSGEGTVTQFYNNSENQEEKVMTLLNNQTQTLPWNDYFYTMSGKEVIIPFDYQGKRLGAIVRRVIDN